MKTMKRILVWSLFVSLAFPIYPVFPQAINADDEVYIVNPTTSAKVFSLSESQRGEWRNYKLGSGKGELFPFFPYIRIRTGDKESIRKIEGGKRYSIIWNKEDSKWDVGEIATHKGISTDKLKNEWSIPRKLDLN